KAVVEHVLGLLVRGLRVVVAPPARTVVAPCGSDRGTVVLGTDRLQLVVVLDPRLIRAGGGARRRRPRGRRADSGPSAPIGRKADAQLNRIDARIHVLLHGLVDAESLV